MKDISTQKGKGCSCKISKFKITLVHLIFGSFHRMSPLVAITSINFQNLSILQFTQWVLIAHNLCSTNGAACKLWNSEGKRKLFLVMGVFSQEQNSQAKNKMGLSMGTYFPDNQKCPWAIITSIHLWMCVCMSHGCIDHVQIRLKGKLSFVCFLQLVKVCHHFSLA